MSRGSIAVLVLALTACAAEVPRTAASFTPQSPNDVQRVLQTEADVRIDGGTGYPRLLPQGTVLKRIGNIPQGEVYRPSNFTLTLEGANVHEVYLVLIGSELVGFYMPVEKAFVLQQPKLLLSFSTRE